MTEDTYLVFVVEFTFVDVNLAFTVYILAHDVADRRLIGHDHIE